MFYVISSATVFSSTACGQDIPADLSSVAKLRCVNQYVVKNNLHTSELYVGGSSSLPDHSPTPVDEVLSDYSGWCSAGCAAGGAV